MKRFIIGTANFGNIYGLSKKSVNKKEILKIIKEAKNLNIKFFDTANFYGKAEKILGKLNLKNFNFITKIKVTKNLIDNPNNIKKIISETIKNLKIKKIYAVLIHNPFFLKKDQQNCVFNNLLKLKKMGLIKKVGVSVYNEKEIKYLSKNFKFDIVQIPYNIFDRRFSDLGWMKKLKNKGIEIHIRSIFLQGILLKKKQTIYFLKWKKIFDHFEKWRKNNNISRLEACIKFAISRKYVDKIIVGIDNANQLKEIKKIKKNTQLFFPKFTTQKEIKLINPTYW